MRSLFPKKVSVQDIEREVTEQLETMVRSGNNPPPASWTLLGGLHGTEQPAPVDPGPVAESAVDVEEEPAPAAPPAEVTVDDEAEAAPRPSRAKGSSSRARSTGAKSGASRSTGGSRGRRSTTASARRSSS